MIESLFSFSMRSNGRGLATSASQPLLADTLWVELGHPGIIDYFLSLLSRWHGSDAFRFAANVMTISVVGIEVTVEEDGEIMPPGRQEKLPLSDFLHLLNVWRTFLVTHGR